MSVSDKSNAIVRLDKSQAAQAVEILARAFRDQQPFLYYYPDEKEREKITPLIISMAVFPAIRYGEVHAPSDQIEGVAVWVPSENYPVSTWKLLFSVPLSVTLGFVSQGGYKLKAFGEYLDRLHARLVPFQHMYLQSLGIDPKFQGKGHAGTFLRYMTGKMDKEGIPCYLETSSEQNVKLYEHFGFKVIDKDMVPDTDLINWAMLRETK